MLKKVYLYRIGSYLRHIFTAWNTGGEGVHSPYLFELVRMVMSDKHQYYKWQEIEKLRQKMLADTREIVFEDYGSGRENTNQDSDRRRVSDIAKCSLSKAVYAKMLYRLVNWLGHQLRTDYKGLTMVELGTSLGVTTAYLASVDKRDKVCTYEGCAEVVEIARDNWKSLGLDTIECRVGCIDAKQLETEIDELDIAFVDANHTYGATMKYFDVLAKKVHDKSVLVLDDIHHSKEMEKAWKEICADERVMSTIDLYQIGLVFFDKRYWRRNYRMRL
jgi:predicted O-methyltransferase YrrM